MEKENKKISNPVSPVRNQKFLNGVRDKSLSGANGVNKTKILLLNN